MDSCVANRVATDLHLGWDLGRGSGLTCRLNAKRQRLGMQVRTRRPARQRPMDSKEMVAGVLAGILRGALLQLSTFNWPSMVRAGRLKASKCKPER